jgi:hypothetical protein
MEPKIFVCEPCNFKSKYKLSLDNHLVSTLHLTGKKKVRSDKVRLDKCPKCDYAVAFPTSMKKHVLNTHATKEERKLNYTYFCEPCNIGEFSKLRFDKHLAAKTHKRVFNIIPEPDIVI